jgi:hypothetical protein
LPTELLWDFKVFGFVINKEFDLAKHELVFGRSDISLLPVFSGPPD